MAEQTTANIRIVLEDASPGGDATSAGGSSSEQRQAGKATEEATRRPASKNVSDDVASIRKQHEKTVTENMRRNLKRTGRQWWQIGRAVRGVLRGTAFAQQGTMASSGVAAWEFGSAGSAMAQFFGNGSSVGVAIGRLGSVIGAAASAVGVFTMAVKGSSDAMEGMAARHAAYSGEVAMAMAQRSVSRIQFEMNQAQRYGQEEADAVRARTKAGIEWDRLFDEVRSLFGKLTTPIVEEFGKFLTNFNRWLGLQDQKWEEGMDGMKMMGRVIQQFERFIGEPHPGNEWMKNTPHLELHDASVDFQGGGVLERRRIGDLDPFDGAL